MESGLKRTQRDYTLAFKLTVVEQVEKGELTYKQAQRRYGLQGRSMALVWLRKHGRQSWSRAASSAAMPPGRVTLSQSKLPVLRNLTKFIPGCKNGIYAAVSSAS